MESPNRSLAKTLTLINLPLSIIGALASIFYIFLLLSSRQHLLEITGSVAMIGFGLWLEYFYYMIWTQDYNEDKERTRWKLSIGYNIIPFVAIIVSIVINSSNDLEPIVCVVLTYPGTVLALSVKALKNLTMAEVDLTQKEP